MELIKEKIVEIKDKYSDKLKPNEKILKGIKNWEGCDKFQKSLIFGTNRFLFSDKYIGFKYFGTLIPEMKLIIFPYDGFKQNMKIVYDGRGTFFQKLFRLKDSVGSVGSVDYTYNKTENYPNGKGFSKTYDHFTELEKNILEEIVNEVTIVINSIKEKNKKIAEEERKLIEIQNQKKEKKRVEKLKSDQTISMSEFDKDGNGELDTVEVKDDFDKLVKKHQSKIIETDRSYIQHFVKVSNYQKQKRKNLQLIFDSIRETKNQNELSSNIELLKEQIHTYELLLFHSLNMVTSLVEDDMFTFYEIYESFDKLEIFNSNHQNELSKGLKNIEGKIGKLITSIRKMEMTIIDELGNLSYVTQESYNQLSNNVSKELESINSSINTNNLLTGINAYQTYKLRKGK